MKSAVTAFALAFMLDQAAAMPNWGLFTCEMAGRKNDNSMFDLVREDFIGQWHEVRREAADMWTLWI